VIGRETAGEPLMGRVMKEKAAGIIVTVAEQVVMAMAGL
jgi:hypothetical protein